MFRFPHQNHAIHIRLYQVLLSCTFQFQEFLSYKISLVIPSSPQLYTVQRCTVESRKIEFVSSESTSRGISSSSSMIFFGYKGFGSPHKTVGFFVRALPPSTHLQTKSIRLELLFIQYIPSLLILHKHNEQNLQTEFPRAYDSEAESKSPTKLPCLGRKYMIFLRVMKSFAILDLFLNDNKINYYNEKNGDCFSTLKSSSKFDSH